MLKACREFQVFVKPVGSICNPDCHYCYYLRKAVSARVGAVHGGSCGLLESAAGPGWSAARRPRRGGDQPGGQGMGG